MDKETVQQLIEERLGSLRTGQLSFPLDSISKSVLDSHISSRTQGLNAAGKFSVSPRLVHSGGIPAQVSTDGTDQTPVATEVYICELFIPCNVDVTGLAIFNGSAVSGNVKVGLADSSGKIIATSASTV